MPCLPGDSQATAFMSIFRGASAGGGVFTEDRQGMCFNREVGTATLQHYVSLWALLLIYNELLSLMVDSSCIAPVYMDNKNKNRRIGVSYADHSKSKNCTVSASQTAVRAPWRTVKTFKSSLPKLKMQRTVCITRLHTEKSFLLKPYDYNLKHLRVCYCSYRMLICSFYLAGFVYFLFFSCLFQRGRNTFPAVHMRPETQCLFILRGIIDFIPKVKINLKKKLSTVKFVALLCVDFNFFSIATQLLQSEQPQLQGLSLGCSCHRAVVAASSSPVGSNSTTSAL